MVLCTERTTAHTPSLLLDQNVRRFEKDFLKEGGLRDRMTRALIEVRKKRDE